MFHKITGSESLHAGLALIQLDQLFQIGPPRWSYLLLAVQVHTTTHCMFYREQLGPTPSKTGYGSTTICHPKTRERQNYVYVA